jgi:hypothetical protein
MNDFLNKARVLRSVLKRTRGRTDLPSPVLYIEWLAGEMKRRVLDKDGNEHVLADAVVQSHYKPVTGAQAKEPIAEHWEAAVAARGGAEAKG